MPSRIQVGPPVAIVAPVPDTASWTGSKQRLQSPEVERLGANPNASEIILQVVSSPHFLPVLSWLLIQSRLAAHHAAPASAARASPPHSATGRQLAWPQAVPPEWHGWQSPGSPRAPAKKKLRQPLPSKNIKKN